MENTNRRRNLIIAAVIGVALIIIITAVIIINNRRTDVIPIENYNELTNATIPSDTKENLGIALYYLLTSHFDLPSDLHEVNATIRPDTYQQTSNMSGIYEATFVLDVQLFQQTYNISLNWSADGSLPSDSLIRCAAKSVSAYPDVMCYGMYDDTSNSVSAYLPYSGALATGQEFTATYAYTTSSGTEQIAITVNNCGDASIISAARTAVEAWVASLDLDPTQYIYLIPTLYQNCIIK